jgi:hypothetical protein
MWRRESGVHSHMNPLFTPPPTARILDWSLPGRRGHYFKAIFDSPPAAAASEKVDGDQQEVR